LYILSLIRHGASLTPALTLLAWVAIRWEASGLAVTRTARAWLAAAPSATRTTWPPRSPSAASWICAADWAWLSLLAKAFRQPSWASSPGCAYAQSPAPSPHPPPRLRASCGACESC
jgi:hypothetical protein